MRARLVSEALGEPAGGVGESAPWVGGVGVQRTSLTHLHG